jgi:hypothetical protein
MAVFTKFVVANPFVAVVIAALIALVVVTKFAVLVADIVVFT